MMASVDGSRSLQGASDEVQTNASVCGPCKNVDVDNRASYYCNDCAEYLCDHCTDHHRKLTLTKNHKIVSGRHAAEISTTRGRQNIAIYCNCSKGQEVKYFCDDHPDIVCDSCKHTKHYKCKVSSMQDKGSNYNRSRIDTVISQIHQLEDDYAQLKEKRNDDSKTLVSSIDECKKQIKAFRKELNGFLDDMEKRMLKLLDSQKDETQKRIDQHISTLTATLKLLETDHKLLRDVKSNGETTLMFAADFQVSKGLQDYNDRLSDIENDVIDIGITFEKNKKLVHLQTEIDSLGALIRRDDRNIHRSLKTLLDSAIQSQKQINVDVSGDSQRHRISGLAVMPTGEVVICDRINSKIKLLDRYDTIKDSLKLKVKPYCVSVVDNKTVIVTLPTSKQLQFIEAFPRLSKAIHTDNEITVLDQFCGIIKML